MKTYTLVCPDPDCAEEFDIELDPATLEDEGDLIECPSCLEEWEWEHDAETDALVLLPDEMDDGEGLEGMPLDSDGEIEDDEE